MCPVGWNLRPCQRCESRASLTPLFLMVTDSPSSESKHGLGGTTTLTEYMTSLHVFALHKLNIASAEAREKYDRTIGL